MAAPLRIGVLGTGRITRKIGPAIARVAGAELAAVGSRDGERAAAWAAEQGATRSHGSYAALLDDPEIDAVYVALPPSLHREWTVRAAERGLHVLCEKPLAPSFGEAAEMVAACRQHGVQLLDGVMWVHTPRAALMRAVIDSDTLGEVRRVTSAFSFPAGWGADEHRFKADLGGGCLLDLGWYSVGVSLWAFGELPESVAGWATWRDGTDRAFTGMLRYGDGRTAGFDCGFELAARRWVEVAGRAGSLVCDDFVRPWDAATPRFWTHGDYGKAAEHRCEPFGQEECLVEAFCRLVRTEPDHFWGERALRVQRVCEALLKAAREGRAVELKE
jgi:predicted dehydrogenase